MGHLDRTKYAADVLEHVLRGVRTTAGDDATTHVLMWSLNPWMAGLTFSAVQISVVRDDAQE